MEVIPSQIKNPLVVSSSFFLTSLVGEFIALGRSTSYHFGRAPWTLVIALERLPIDIIACAK